MIISKVSACLLEQSNHTLLHFSLYSVIFRRTILFFLKGYSNSLLSWEHGLHPIMQKKPAIQRILNTPMGQIPCIAGFLDTNNKRVDRSIVSMLRSMFVLWPKRQYNFIFHRLGYSNFRQGYSKSYGGIQIAESAVDWAFSANSLFHSSVAAEGVDKKSERTIYTDSPGSRSRP